MYQEQAGGQDPHTTQNNGKGTTGKTAEQGDYIEFEEVK